MFSLGLSRVTHLEVSLTIESRLNHEKLLWRQQLIEPAWGIYENR
jgi:hypothetical protein